MKYLKMAYIDLIKIKLSKIAIVVFLGFVVWMQYKTNNPTQAMIYALFGSVIFSMQPFLIEQAEESGFFNLLPYSKKERIIGRYFFGLLLTFIALIFSVLNVIIYYKGVQSIPDWYLLFLCIVIGVAIIFISFEFTISYMVGKLKSRQLGGILSMIPGFLFFFGTNYVLEHTEINIPKLITWGLNHMLLCGSLFIGFSLIVLVIGIGISLFVTKNRDRV